MIRAVIFDMYATLVTLEIPDHYRSEAMARDAGMSLSEFRALWAPTEEARSDGSLSFETAIASLLKTAGRFSPLLAKEMCEKRAAFARRALADPEPEVTAMLTDIRSLGLKTGLISNCYREEAAAIRGSAIAPLMDVLMLSWEQRVLKPSPEIFLRCTAALGVSPEECVYIGDGGSRELEAASALGMTALRAAWFPSRETEADHPGFTSLETPRRVPAQLKGALL